MRDDVSIVVVTIRSRYASIVLYLYFVLYYSRIVRRVCHADDAGSRYTCHNVLYFIIVLFRIVIYKIWNFYYERDISLIYNILQKMEFYKNILYVSCILVQKV